MTAKPDDTCNAARRTMLGLLAAGAGAVCLPGRAAPVATDTDVMPQFWRAYDDTMASADRAQALLAAFFQPQGELMAGAGLKPTAATIAGWLKRFDPLAAEVRRLSVSVPAIYGAQLPKFRAAFPDFDAAAAPVYFMPSLCQFDGHLQPWRGQLPLFIGLDGVRYYHGAQADLTVLLNHEMFHLYQAQKNHAMMMAPSLPVFANLWMEGVAVYVSQLLSPGASRLHVLLDDQVLAGAGPAMLRTIAADMLTRFESTSDADAQRFFTSGFVGDIPPRGGYLVGLMVAERAGAGMTPSQMAALPMDEIRPVVRRHLMELAGA